MTSLSSLCLSPLSSARCRWPTSCFSRPSAIRVAHVIRLRSRLERPGRSHTSPNSTRSLRSTRAGTMSRTWSRADAGCCDAMACPFLGLRPSCGYPSFVDYNSGAGRPVLGESPSETPRHAAHRLANRAVEVHYGSKCEELEPSISGPLLPSKADVRVDVPVGRVVPECMARPCGTRWTSKIDECESCINVSGL